jgi:four helix bundle protein
MRTDRPDNLIVNLTFDFSLGIIEYYENLLSINRFKLADQIFRSGTSIGANVREAQNAETPADFIHKMKIAAKESDETEYWLELCDRSGVYPKTTELKKDLKSITRVLDKIISSSKKNHTFRSSSNRQIIKSSNQIT